MALASRRVDQRVLEAILLVRDLTRHPDRRLAARQHHFNRSVEQHNRSSSTELSDVIASAHQRQWHRLAVGNVDTIAIILMAQQLRDDREGRNAS